MKNTKYIQSTITVNGEELTVYRIDNDVNGNPRYAVHFLSLNIKPQDYGKIPNLTKYRAKWFGGGYVFQSYNIEHDVQWALDTVAKFYADKEQN